MVASFYSFNHFSLAVSALCKSMGWDVRHFLRHPKGQKPRGVVVGGGGSSCGQGGGGESGGGVSDDVSQAGEIVRRWRGAPINLGPTNFSIEEDLVPYLRDFYSTAMASFVELQVRAFCVVGD